MFADKVTIKVLAGAGGNGRTNFRSTRGVTKGGPDGGDGGQGGNVVLQADHNTNTLSKYRTSKLWEATAGIAGGTNRRHGKNGQDIVLPVPPGTLIYEGDELINDLAQNGDECIVAHGGRGGFGNAHFKSSVRQSPKFAELGEPGEDKELNLELKLVADVGIVGLPNAGKSTLLSIISNAKPEIANYPFTTLAPNLGVVDIDQNTFLAADIPGLIEGASQGKGLGDDFLRHVERTRLLLHLIDVTSPDVAKDYLTIQQELHDYKIDLSDRPQLVVLTKVESVQNDDLKRKVQQLVKVTKLKSADIYQISAVASIGIAALLRATVKKLDTLQSAALSPQPSDEVPVITLDDSKNWKVEKVDDVFVVTGADIEGFAKRTNFGQYQAVQRLRNILERKGVLREVEKLGGSAGSTIEIAGHKLPW